MMSKGNLKKVLFWTTVLIVPGGSLLLAYRLGKDHQRVKDVLNKQLNKQLNRLRRKK